MEVNKIYCENCLDTMARMPDGFIDLTVTSPPYDDLREYHGCEWNFKIFQQVAQELYRVTKPGGVVVWVVNDKTEKGSETLTSFLQAIYFKELGFNIYDTMIYEKPPYLPTESRYYNVFEYMFVVSKGIPTTLNFINDRKNISKGSKKFKDKVIGKNSFYDGKKENGFYEVAPIGRRSNIWYYPTGNNNSTKDEIAKLHRAIFPEQLAADHIYSWSNEGDLIYDPFGGSGTTAKMAHLMKRNWIISEISEEYCKLAEKRLEPYLNQLTLAI